MVIMRRLLILNNFALKEVEEEGPVGAGLMTTVVLLNNFALKEVEEEGPVGAGLMTTVVLFILVQSYIFFLT